MSHWDRGRRPANPRDEASFKEVSVFDNREAAARKARLLQLGEYIAELEVPDSVPRSHNAATGHVGLRGATPEQLLEYVQSVELVDPA
jgi:hypothetical protein